jgi:hypothetical protein
MSLIYDLSFSHVPFTRAALHGALRRMCPRALKAYDAPTTAAMRNAWQPENPARFCCYFVSEMVYWYCAPISSTPMSLVVPGDDTLHRFIEWPDKTIVDVTCDQFSFPLDYSQRKPRMFLQTGCTGPSKRARQLAAELELGPDFLKHLKVKT